MKYGGKNFFEYVLNAHKTIKNGVLTLNKWQNHVRKLFKQMCLFINWLHINKCCHLDISLENLLINNDKVIHFCDFGLAEYFKNDTFKCKKYVGKKSYQCPEIHNRSGYFDARKADIWCLGICLFMMLMGAPLYKKPSITDSYYQNLYNGHLKKMISHWNMNQYMPNLAFDLLRKILKPEELRINMKQLLQHSYIKNIKTYNN